MSDAFLLLLALFVAALFGVNWGIFLLLCYIYLQANDIHSALKRIKP